MRHPIPYSLADKKKEKPAISRERGLFIMTYIFQNWNRTKEVTINSHDFPDAYLYANSIGVSFELLERERLETGIFHYNYNDYIITVKADVITVCSMKAPFEKFIEELQDYFCK